MSTCDQMRKEKKTKDTKWNQLLSFERIRIIALLLFLLLFILFQPCSNSMKPFLYSKKKTKKKKSRRHFLIMNCIIYSYQRLLLIGFIDLPRYRHRHVMCLFDRREFVNVCVHFIFDLFTYFSIEKVSCRFFETNKNQ